MTKDKRSIRREPAEKSCAGSSVFKAHKSSVSKAERAMDAPFLNPILEEMLAPSWAWRMIHKP